MPHKVEISDKTYEDLKEFCRLNSLKIGQYADKLIRDGLMIEMYGDVPFTNYRKPPKEMVEIPAPDKLKEQEDIPPEIQKVVDEHFWDMLEDKKPDEPKYLEPSEEVVNETKERIEQIEETMRQVGVPDKVVNKITKRRLK